MGAAFDESFKKRYRRNKEALEWYDALAMAVAVIAIVFTFFVRIVKVDGHSMDPTLFNGERILINLMKQPDYGDIVVVDGYTSYGKPLVKRVIGKAGDTIDIDFTVLLTHIGFEEDKKLAALLDPDWGVDVIIGGHSHTKLEEPAKVNDIYIVQAGTGTDEIGRFDIMVDTDLNAIDTFTWRMVPIDDMHCPRDEELERFIQHYKSVTSEKYDRIITRFSCELTHPKRNQETALGDLIADILRDSFGIDLMLMGSGAIRSYSLGPVVHYADLVECLPYDDAVYMLKVTGTQLERMIRHILRDEAFQGEHTEFYQFSHGMRIVWSRSGQVFRELTLDGEVLHADRLYSVAMQKYHYNNLKPFLNITLEEAEQNGKIRVLSTSARDVVEEYLTVNQHLSREVEGRLVVEA